MKKIFTLLNSVALFAAFIAFAEASVENGAAAPDFTLTNDKGEQHSLSDYKGKYVVLEWTNHQCPFVVRHYDSQNMQTLQKEYTDKDVIWLSIVSSAPGKQGYCTPEESIQVVKDTGAAMTARLLDTDGTVGKLYSARTTPHMFIIDPDGVLIYQGAIDNASRGRSGDEGLVDYVSQALTEHMAGKPVSDANTRPYGCSVKY